MRYSRELPRERRPLHHILLDVGNVHRGEHTQSSVVRRASWDLLARLDGCTAADAAQPYDSSCELNTTHTLPRHAVSTLDVSALESTTQEVKLYLDTDNTDDHGTPLRHAGG
jgi:hypothetical protein